jgi:hypothetical protein
MVPPRPCCVRLYDERPITTKLIDMDARSPPLWRMGADDVRPDGTLATA